MNKIVVFIGAEGSGKTVNALRLSTETDLPYISTGDTIRDLAANDYTTKYGDLCRKMFEDKTYLAGNILLEILTLRLENDDAKKGFVLDGGMRTLEETEKFYDILEKAGLGDLPLQVIWLKIPEEVTYERLTGENGRNRHDDTVEKVAKRLNSFYSTLDERLAIIKSHENWRLKEVDATPSIQAVYEQVATRVNED